MTVAAIIPAAGRGLRLGGGLPKAFRPLGGVPLFVHAVHALRASQYVESVIVVTLPDRLAEVGSLLGPAATVVCGGESRHASVAAGLAVLPPPVDVVLIHDAARPLVPPGVVDAVVEAVLAGASAAVPVLPVVDTLKTVDGAGRVVRTIPRDTIRAVQTPQGFRRSVLVRAHAEADPAAPATDDAALVEALGIPVMTVPGSPTAIKITYSVDLLLAEALLHADLAAEPAE
ncbi:MAG: 2-C-methyl-D-erythritol 4-phosphate cytidylyltransferase [Actinobacteria bacterium]|nr:2-C-methyl-D-erythritol 4-phosphate cytidylyltransferase [Actinomycetota bacterium]